MYSAGIEIERIFINVTKLFGHYLAPYEFPWCRDKNKDGIKIKLILYE